MKPLTDQQQFWNTHLQRAVDSNTSLADYARANDLKVQGLYNWRNTLRKRELVSTTSVQFTEVVQSRSPMPGMTLHLGGAQLVFNELPDPTWLWRVLRDA